MISEKENKILSSYIKNFDALIAATGHDCYNGSLDEWRPKEVTFDSEWVNSMKDSISNTSQYLMAATGQTINSEDFVDEETVNKFSTSIGKSEILNERENFLTRKNF